MNYQDVRDQIQSGEVLAWSHRGWGSWNDIKIQLVRFFTQSEYSHVGMAYVMDGRVFVIEAVRPLVRIFPLSKSGDFYRLPIKAHWTQEVAEYALSHVGEPYSQWQAITAFFKPLAHDGLWECAELVLDLTRKMGLDLGQKATPTAVVYEIQKQGIPCTLIINSGSK